MGVRRLHTSLSTVELNPGSINGAARQRTEATKFLRRGGRRDTTDHTRAMDVTPQTLNEAMAAYVVTLPMRGRLADYITAGGLDDKRQEIVAELDALLKTAEKHLWSQPDGVSWTLEFLREYRDLLHLAHPWMDEGSFAHVVAYSRWLCWHEGLNTRES